MKTKNLGFLYNSLYYKNPSKIKEINSSKIKEINTEILCTKYQADFINEETSENSIELFVKNNGLITGIGYEHGDKSNTESFKLGFFFDHTSGQPIITGATMKGVIRSVFPMNEKDDDIKKSKTQYIIHLLKEIISEKKDDAFVNNLEMEIFDGFQFDEDNSNNKPKLKSIYKRDKFLDAVIIQGGKGGKIFGEDTIAPHKSPFENPEPVKFLKILGRVKFRFNFEFHNGLLEAGQKQELIKKILLDVSIGAKGKGGYGFFQENENNIKTKRTHFEDYIEEPCICISSKIKKSIEFSGSIVEIFEEYNNEKNRYEYNVVLMITEGDDFFYLTKKNFYIRNFTPVKEKKVNVEFTEDWKTIDKARFHITLIDENARNS